MSDASDFSPVKRALLEIRQLRARLAAARPAKPNPVAIVGASVRLPGGVTDLGAFWELLEADRDAITVTPAARWDAEAIYSADADAPGKSYSRHGAYLDDVDQFDADFFGISPREAESMDPQHRILLELTWEALENAAISPASLSGTKTGVFVGLCNSDYGRMLFDDRDDIDAYTSFGMAASIASGRISYFLNARGPSVVLDTACSSSLSAVHLACNSLALGESDTVIAGAANLMLTPEATISFTKARMLAPDGQCKTFDASADGYVRGEGAAVVVLKRLADAQAAGDSILAVIRGSAMNHDGRSAGLTAPNGPAQEAVIRAALADAEMAAENVDYIEAHGTGTSLGDPIELQALANAYGARATDRRLAIGSLKTKVGHLEATAGIAGLIKVVLALDHGTLPAHRNVGTPTELFPWESSSLEIVRANRAWARGDRPRIAGISAFGFSGTNVHVLVEEAPPLAPESDAVGTPRLFVLSARSDAALRQLAQRYASLVATSDESLAAICRAAGAGRAQLRHRLSVRVSDKPALVRALNAWLAGAPAPELMTGVAADPPPEFAGEVTSASLESLQRQYVAGATIDWNPLDGAGRRAPNLPTYPFERQTYWRPRERTPRTRVASTDWNQIVGAAEQQSEHGPLGWDLASYDDARWQRYDDLTAGHAVNWFASVGAFRTPGEHRTVDDMLAAYAVKPIYRNLVLRWLRLLARRGVLREDGDAFVAEQRLQRADVSTAWNDVERLLADDPDVLAYARRSSPKIGEMLTGRTSPLDVLFEHGELESAEGAYGRSVPSRYLSAMVAAIVRNLLVQRDPNVPFRLLEAGAGTGGTTLALAPFFPADGEYWFTDVSDGFLSRAKRKFGDNPAFRFAKFDLEAPVPGDLPAGACDVVLAANVVHATRDAGASLDRLRELLKPGGVLILVEVTKYHRILDLTIAFVDGWSAFDDAYRSSEPLLDADRWTSLMRERGFVEAERFPHAGTPADAIGQHVIVARNGDAVREARGAQPGAAQRGASGADRPLPSPIPVPDLSGAGEAERRERLRTFVAACVAHVLHLENPAALGVRERFTDLGMDSLMALQLKSVIGAQLGIEDRLAATIAFDTGTVEELAEQLLALLGTAAPAKTASAVAPAGGDVISADALAAYSDDEVEAMLAERLRANSKLLGPK
ncbi:MAG TPA: beta-ketoacyl synthase N-terminal-like domain-containing protein [Candidatus Elarobacter sp.]|nr:beta-ketoacyl synthase N-terminal-like domain-containing protein [Candidatus Elarobacter sp.]